MQWIMTELYTKQALIFITLLPLVLAQFNVTRSKTDEFAFRQCIDCSQYSAYCISTACCKECKCYYGKTYFKNKDGLKCDASPGHSEGCKYHFVYHNRRGQSLLSVILFEEASITQLGKLIVSKKDKNCKIIEDKCMYWNLNKWTNLFSDGRELKDFFVNDDKKKDRKSVKFNSHGKDLSLYDGLLIKMGFSCSKSGESCFMFKFDGNHYYGINSTPTDANKTLPTSTVLTTPLHSKQKSQSVNIGLVIGIVVVVILAILAAVLVLLWRKRKHNSKDGVSVRRRADNPSQKRLLKKKGKGEDVYELPDVKESNKGDKESEFDNPGYLIPIDSKKLNETQTVDGVVYLDPDALFVKKKDANYDYPDLQKHMQKQPSHHIYADVSADDAISANDHSNKVNSNDGYAKINDTDTASGYQALDMSCSENKGDNLVMNSNEKHTGYQALVKTKPTLNAETSVPSPTMSQYFELEDEKGLDDEM